MHRTPARPQALVSVPDLHWPERVAAPRARGRAARGCRSLTSSLVAREPARSTVDASNASETAGVGFRSGSALARSVAAAVAHRRTTGGAPRTNSTAGARNTPGRYRAAGFDTSPRRGKPAVGE